MSNDIQIGDTVKVKMTQWRRKYWLFGPYIEVGYKDEFMTITAMVQSSEISDVETKG